MPELGPDPWSSVLQRKIDELTDVKEGDPSFIHVKQLEGELEEAKKQLQDGKIQGLVSLPG